MNRYFKFILGISIVAFASCRKDTMIVVPENPSIDNYSSLQDFYKTNGVVMQNYTIDANNGGSFTTPQGTVVVIPSNAFVTQSNQPVTGNVTVQFKDIYKKSDMLLSNMPTMLSYGEPLKSAGEFYIKVLSSNLVVQMAPGKKIEVDQPVINTGILDSAMIPLGILQDSIGFGWMGTPYDSLSFNPENYVFSL